MGVILTVIGALAALAVGLVGYGKTLPAAHVASRPRLLVTRIVGASAYGGTWTFEIAPDGHDASTVTIAERGEVYNPAFRVLSRHVFGRTRSLDAYLATLYAALS